MVVFVDKYTENVEKLQETMECLEMDLEICVFEWGGFFPEGISNPYEQYVSKQNQEQYAKGGLPYDALEMPEYADIYINGRMGEIYYMGVKLATVYFHEEGENSDAKLMEQEEKPIVQRVEWQMESGWIYKVDFYNKYGLKSVSEFRDMDGSVESRSYYSDRNQEVIVEHPGNDVVTLLENGKVKNFFDSRREFIEHYVEEVYRNERCAIVVQDEKTLGNLQIKPDAEQKWEFTLLFDEELLSKYTNMGGKNGIRFLAIPKCYPENRARGEALILTNSDEIEKIEELTRELPEVTFHIAANTLVSDKLKKLGEQENVNVYEGVGQPTLDRLWEQCDFYLDINHWNEIRDAVNVAHQKNLLIMGFENTLHHGEMLVKECVYSPQEYEKMASAIKNIMKSLELMQKLLKEQQQNRKEIWKKLFESANRTGER